MDKKDKLSPIQKLTGDEGAVCKLPFDYYNLWCCDCNLRHQVFIEKIDKDYIRICLTRDETATEDRRKLEKLRKKYKKLKSRGLTARKKSI